MSNNFVTPDHGHPYCKQAYLQATKSDRKKQASVTPGHAREHKLGYSVARAQEEFNLLGI